MNNALNKEDFLNKYDLIFYEASADIVEGELEKVAKAMNEYAKQESRREAIGFAKWVSYNDFEDCQVPDGWVSPNDYYSGCVYNDEQLYEQYLLHKQNKDQ